MRAHHNSRDVAYRRPFGAVAVGDEITLSLDVSDASNPSVLLRTWTESAGETIRTMHAAGPGEAPATGATRYQVTFAPEKEGITWYHFVITEEGGKQWRYGAQHGQTGGTGQLMEWEPPSFQLTAFGPRLAPPDWHEPIAGFLRDEEAAHEPADIVATLLENYPLAPFQDDLPWRLEANAAEEPLDPAYFIVSDDVLGFWRRNNADEPICILINASMRAGHDVAVPLPDENATELISGYYAAIVGADEACALDCAPACPDREERREGRFARVHLNPWGAAVLHFHASERLQRPVEPGIGVLAHVTSLPAAGTGAGGTLGAPARAFVDWLAQTGARYWQVLPANPTDEYGSPYAGISAFAGNTRLLEDGSHEAVCALAAGHEAEYRAFCEREADWLEPYAGFMAIRAQMAEQVAWQEWPEALRRYDPDAIAGNPELSQLADRFKQEQFAFEYQWRELRTYANERGIEVIGDMPIYVSADSADVWANPAVFQLGPDGLPAAVAGCPPDDFAADGQLWGNPLYDWDALRKQGYAWWLRRFERAFALYDWVRLDHFIGFARYYSIPAGKRATEGAYRPGPGAAFFRRACEEFGQLPIIAEDLGLLTPSVRALSASCGFPGMDILQFADGGDPLSGWAPRPEKIAYTGTHDNQTLVGFCADRYPHLDARETAEALMKMVASCPAPVRIFPLQDLLGLGDEARMNVPGVAEGNWAWRAERLPEAAVLANLASR